MLSEFSLARVEAGADEYWLFVAMNEDGEMSIIHLVDPEQAGTEERAA